MQFGEIQISCNMVRGFLRLRNVNIEVFFYYLFNCYMFQSYDHIQVDIHFIELALLTTDTLFLEY
jgi:hypothetical protein